MMAIDVACPACGKTLKVAEAHAGKHGKCPQCGGRIFIPQPAAALPDFEVEPPAPPVEPPPARQPAAAPPRTSPARKASTAAREAAVSAGEATGRGRWHWLVTAVAAAVALFAGGLAGYIGGMMRAEMASQTEIERLEARVAELSAATPALPPQPAAPPPQPQTAAEALISSLQGGNFDPTDMTGVLEFGESYVGPEFTLSVADARVDRPAVDDLLGIGGTASRALKLTVNITNTHDRKVIGGQSSDLLAQAQSMLGGRFQLHDDVGNVIQPISANLGMLALADTGGSQPIPPGETGTREAWFAVPPPRTEFLVLTVSHAAFGGEGRSRFKIPVVEITGL